MSSGVNSQVVKVQRTLFSTDGSQPFFVYGEGQYGAGMVQPENMPDIIKKAIGQRAKAYFYAVLVQLPEGGRAWAFNGKEAPAQDW